MPSLLGRMCGSASRQSAQARPEPRSELRSTQGRNRTVDSTQGRRVVGSAHARRAASTGFGGARGLAGENPVIDARSSCARCRPLRPALRCAFSFVPHRPVRHGRSLRLGAGARGCTVSRRRGCRDCPLGGVLQRACSRHTAGVEPATRSLTVICSTQLSYVWAFQPGRAVTESNRRLCFHRSTSELTARTSTRRRCCGTWTGQRPPDQAGAVSGQPAIAAAHVRAGGSMGLSRFSINRLFRA